MLVVELYISAAGVIVQQDVKQTRDSNPLVIATGGIPLPSGFGPRIGLRVDLLQEGT